MRGNDSKLHLNLSSSSKDMGKYALLAGVLSATVYSLSHTNGLVPKLGLKSHILPNLKVSTALAEGYTVRKNTVNATNEKLRDKIENASYLSYITNNEPWHDLGKNFANRYQNTLYRGERANMNKKSSLDELEWVLSPE